jgi:hypothetical protein
MLFLDKRGIAIRLECARGNQAKIFCCGGLRGLKPSIDLHEVFDASLRFGLLQEAGSISLSQDSSFFVSIKTVSPSDTTVNSLQ